MSARQEIAKGWMKMSCHFVDDLSIRDDVLMRAWLCMAFGAWCVGRSPWSRSVGVDCYGSRCMKLHGILCAPLSARAQAFVYMSLDRGDPTSAYEVRRIRRIGAGPSRRSKAL